MQSRRFYNRELSWLNFNERILDEATNLDNPPLERARFLSIVSSNLDEFFMVRVGKLERKKDMGRQKTDPAGYTPKEQLDLIYKKAKGHITRQYRALNNHVLPALEEAGMMLKTPAALDSRQHSWLLQYYQSQVLPVLSPRTIQERHPFPIL
ncbi:MAG: RNA degradosome polyphosphate kinase, partial [Clostridiales bacterium]|nr:RNA degradosome polyphosphate kinase [Clostridiales bacterium]